MNYWQGCMDWPLKEGWRCETCGKFGGLEWGLVHGECRCNICHTVYQMRPEEERLETPLCCLKEEYKQAAIKGFVMFSKPIDQWTDSMWDEALTPNSQVHPVMQDILDKAAHGPWEGLR